MSEPARLHSWEGRALDEWRTRWQLPGIVALAETPSTNDVARAMAEQGAPAGLLVMAEHQTAGRGRMQRPWTDAPGRSLLLSFVLRPAPGRAAPSGTAPGTAPLRVGLAIAAAIREAVGLEPRLKWPNDVIVAGAKLAGILCEAAGGADPGFIIAGIGMNVLQRDQDWPAELKGRAISIAQAARSAPERAAMMDAVVAAMRPLLTRALDPLSDHELRAYAGIDALRGREVTVTGAVDLHGIAAGIAPDGALLLDTADGTCRVTSGTVRPARPRQHTTPRNPQ